MLPRGARQAAADARSAARQARYRAEAALDNEVDPDTYDSDDLTDEQRVADRWAKFHEMQAVAKNYVPSPNLNQQLRPPPLRPSTHILQEERRLREVSAAKLAISLLGPQSAKASGLRGRMGRAFTDTYRRDLHNLDEAIEAAFAEARINYDRKDPVLLALLGPAPEPPLSPGRTEIDEGFTDEDIPPPAPKSILDTARAQHSGTLYDEKAPFVFDMNPSSDEESSDDGDIPFGPMSRKRIVA
jgi:hypothetical protein